MTPPEVSVPQTATNITLPSFAPLLLVRQVNIGEAWTRVAGGECLYHMPTTDILGYCFFDQVIDLADTAVTAAIEAEMAKYLNGTGANYTVVSSEASETSLYEGGTFGK